MESRAKCHPESKNKKKNARLNGEKNVPQNSRWYRIGTVYLGNNEMLESKNSPK